MITRVRVAVALLVVAGLAAACTGGGSSAPSTTASASASTPPVATVAATWRASALDLWHPPASGTSPQFWTTASSVVVLHNDELDALSATTGARRWRLALPAALCAVSSAPNADDVAAVLLGHGSGVDEQACATAAAVDLRTGKLLWTKSVDHLSSYGFDTVAIGPRAVAVTNLCDSALTLSVRDGSPLVKRTEHSGGCFNSYAADGRVLVDGVDHTTHGTLVGYDAVTGRRLWSAALHGDAASDDPNPQLDRVVSSDPLIVDARIDSHRYFQRVDTRVGTLTPIGRESNESYPAPFVRPDGHDLLVQYGASQVLFDYDATSGREVHHTVLDDGETAVGVLGGRVISVEAGGNALGAGRLAIVSTDPASGTRTLLAATKLDGLSAYLGRGLGFDAVLVGRTLVVSDGSHAAGFTVPRAGGVPLSSLATRAGYGAHDLTPEQVADLCPAITPATRRELGFVHPSEQTPADCDFVEPEANHDIVDLRVSTSAAVAKGRRSADAVAHADVTGLAKRDTTNHLPAGMPVSGLGDEAYEVVSNTKDQQLARVVARRGNVTVYVEVLGDGAFPLPVARLRQGARSAAADLVAAIDRLR
ncbi:PQQ-binding-like beta-propeller repeat protein [Jatrophihabitans endophyticus]|uniref:outer membrane protein assembly factor BamB family protein n=1 Tax=Jatrophihabitans endophyticus TaxID=1206085 RepID=UPI001A003964|nr:PQQ-binding-like beta-propeller repeat protein [Jatrophihabitans endophyticus]MBE7188782.1 PQQ-binding-like beta-propeller repeat protein [Jatrophihabitans endophyticus]